MDVRVVRRGVRDVLRAELELVLVVCAREVFALGELRGVRERCGLRVGEEVRSVFAHVLFVR